MNIKCKNCNVSKQYPSEKEAYLDGWYLETMTIGNYILPKGMKICEKCAKSNIGATVTEEELE